MELKKMSGCAEQLNPVGKTRIHPYKEQSKSGMDKETSRLPNKERPNKEIKQKRTSRYLPTVYWSQQSETPYVQSI